jgi:hypothetical protein
VQRPFGVLAARLASRRDTNLKIHCDRLSLVDQLNKFQLRHPLDFDLKDIQDQSIILRILHEVRTRIGTTTFTHVKAPKRGTMSETPFEMLTINVQHQELNKVADRLAKGSLSQPSATIPFTYEFLPSVSVCVNHEAGAYVFENRAHNLFTKHYKSLNKQYHFRGQWHRHLLTAAIWQEASLHILHSKLSTTGSLRKFLVQILGRTLPTFHRLHKIRPQLYLDANCTLCSSTDETIEHLFFHCPFFSDARKAALTSATELLKSQQIAATAQELHDALHSHIFHPLFDERSFSASQLPTSFQRWLEPRCSSSAKALKVGKLLHALLADTYQQIWHLRCDEIKAKGLLFKDRLHMLPPDKLLAEMSSDDFIAFADAWRQWQTPLPTWQHHQPRPRRGRRRAPASTAAAQPGTPILQGPRTSSPASTAAAQPGAHILRGHRPHAPAAAAQQGRTSPPPSPLQIKKRPSSARKRTRIPDLNVPASSSPHKKRRPPSLLDMPVDTPSISDHMVPPSGTTLPLFPLHPTSTGTLQADHRSAQSSFVPLYPSNRTPPKSSNLSDSNKRPRRVLDLN